jgi:hypothetical protein
MMGAPREGVKHFVRLLATVGEGKETDALRARLGTALNQRRLVPPLEPFLMMP